MIINAVKFACKSLKKNKKKINLFALMANQLTSFWPVCVCLCVGNDAFLGPHCNLHLHACVSSHLDQVIHRRLNKLFWVLTTILCSTTTC